MALPLWFEIATLGILVAIMAVDLAIAQRRPRTPSIRECAVWIAVYVALAFVFAAVLALAGFENAAVQFVTGWATEYSLSIDNLFVFVVILASFAVPVDVQQRLLFVGIVIALILRGIFIFVGATLVSRFDWIFYLFGGFLIYTSVMQAAGSSGDANEPGAITRFFRARLRISDRFDGARVRTLVDGRMILTPVLAVVAVIGITDLLFAFDSIPAIFGITHDAFIVLTTNIFALMGLRQLYFLLGSLAKSLSFLKYGVAAILAFLGLKLVSSSLHENSVPFINGGRGLHWAPVVDNTTSLVVIVGLLLLAVLASLLKSHFQRPRAT